MGCVEMAGTISYDPAGDHRLIEQDNCRIMAQNCFHGGWAGFDLIRIGYFNWSPEHLFSFRLEKLDELIFGNIADLQIVVKTNLGWGWELDNISFLSV